ncbi:hypothetical protein [Candidatus Nitrosotalea sp. FS]|uniref:hypothetical protein n=1 Tax=Candidatus Nitrosotalea sp. FS TaxID=2341021 RepID=UPI00210660A5|nr:hypothetical protein [Candidatus Nitrosotalea sp. FS]
MVSTDIFICGLVKLQNMHDSESSTFHPVNKNEEFCESLKKIGLDAKANQIDSDDAEKENYYSKYYSHTPSMVTNHGTITIKGTNIDVVQIIQKG